MNQPSLMKLEKHFGKLVWKRGQNPKIWIIELEDLHVSFEAVGSSISENRFMIHILNILNLYNELELGMMERRVGDVEKPLMIEDIQGELSLRYERLTIK
jgi:hypothetical protein